jgi:hypothetical protein
MTYFGYTRRAWPCGPRLAYAGLYFPTTCESRQHRAGRGASFGVRRPLRYLGYHLDLDDGQMRRVAAILNRLKTEREQAALDEKRSAAAVAELMTGETPLDEQLAAALAPRIDSAERLKGEITRAIKELHEVLDADQRERLADLLRSGTLSL